jgi:hypothetical protein
MNTLMDARLKSTEKTAFSILSLMTTEVDSKAAAALSQSRLP